MTDSLRTRSSEIALKHFVRYLKLLNERIRVWFNNENGVLTTLTGETSTSKSIGEMVQEALALIEELQWRIDQDAVVPKLKGIRYAAERRVNANQHQHDPISPLDEDSLS